MYRATASLTLYIKVFIKYYCDDINIIVSVCKKKYMYVCIELFSLYSAGIILLILWKVLHRHGVSVSTHSAIICVRLLFKRNAWVKDTF